MEALTATATRVGRLRARCAGVDSTSAQLRLGAVLGSAALRPRALPPGALLCVRSLADPLPGTVPLDGLRLGPPAEWQDAVEDSLDALLQRAARPALAAVPSSAEAVLFADRAELLACLARDGLDGTAWTRWWWKELRRRVAPGRDPVAEAWLETPADAPAAFALLAQRGEAVRFARALEPRVARTLAVRIAVVHGAPELAQALETDGIDPARNAESVVERPRPARTRFGVAPRARAREPETETTRSLTVAVPEATAAELAVEQALLLTTALVLRREPALARSRALARVVMRAVAAGAFPTPRPATRRDLRRPSTPPLRVGPVAPDETPPRPGLDDPRPSAVRTRVSRRGAARSTEHAVPHADLLRGKQTPTPRPATRREAARPGEGPNAPEPTHPREPKRAPTAPTDRVQPGATRSAPKTTAAVATKPVRRSAAPAPPPLAAPEPAPIDFVLGEAIETELGGLFFLLDLALVLGLYGDFTTPERRGIALDPWDLVTLLGKRLLNGYDPADPVWPLLAKLAGRRRRERPGRGFTPPRDWRVPVEWLGPFDGSGSWRWSAARDVLRLMHPAGFPVVAVALRGRDPRPVLERELRRYRVRGDVTRASLPRESTRPVHRWAERLAAYVAARIQGALGADDRRHALDTLLRRRARVHVTSAAVDVALSLSALPIEIRLAGLDRDPGWIPAAGRSIAFHFA